MHSACSLRFALVLLSQPLTLCIQCRSVLAKLLALFVKLRTDGLFEYDPFFSQQSLGVAEFGLLPLNQLLLLTQTTCPQFQFGSELAMFAANTEQPRRRTARREVRTRSGRPPAAFGRQSDRPAADRILQIAAAGLRQPPTPAAGLYKRRIRRGQG
jgi:hypothetical protein